MSENISKRVICGSKGVGFLVEDICFTAQTHNACMQCHARGEKSYHSPHSNIQQEHTDIYV